MKKLVKAEFHPDSAKEMDLVVKAFCRPFPSLDGVSGLDVWAWLGDDADERKDAAAARLRDALEESSQGKWAGDVYILWRADVGHPEPRFVEARIIPWTGDRLLRITDSGVVICDYSERPSRTAAWGVIELIEKRSVHLYNSPEWVEAEDEI